MIKVTTKIIHETPDKKFVIIDGVCYSREAIESWASNELAELRNKLIHKNHEAAMDYENAIFEAFEPYIKKAEIREERKSDYIALAQTIRRMPREDVITLFADYFNEFLSKSNREGSKNE